MYILRETEIYITYWSVREYRWFLRSMSSVVTLYDNQRPMILVKTHPKGSPDVVP